MSKLEEAAIKYATLALSTEPRLRRGLKDALRDLRSAAADHRRNQLLTSPPTNTIVAQTTTSPARPEEVREGAVFHATVQLVTRDFEQSFFQGDSCGKTERAATRFATAFALDKLSELLIQKAEAEERSDS